jgi:hypothetical protein
MAELVPATNTIRWSLGPSGTVVSFAEDVGLPNLFNTGPCRSHILPSFCCGWSNSDMKAGVLYLFLCSPAPDSSLHMELLVVWISSPLLSRLQVWGTEIRGFLIKFLYTYLYFSYLLRNIYW